MSVGLRHLYISNQAGQFLQAHVFVGRRVAKSPVQVMLGGRLVLICRPQFRHADVHLPAIGRLPTCLAVTRPHPPLGRQAARSTG